LFVAFDFLDKVKTKDKVKAGRKQNTAIGRHNLSPRFWLP